MVLVKPEPGFENGYSPADPFDAANSGGGHSPIRAAVRFLINSPAIVLRND